MCDLVRRRSCLTFLSVSDSALVFFTSRSHAYVTNWVLFKMFRLVHFICATVVWNLCTPHQYIFHLDLLSDPTKNKKRKNINELLSNLSGHFRVIQFFDWNDDVIGYLRNTCSALFMMSSSYDFISRLMLMLITIILLFIQSPSLPPFNRLDFIVYSFVQFLICNTVFYLYLFVCFICCAWLT